MTSRGRTAERKAEVLPVFRIRDFVMEPSTGTQKSFAWMQFMGSMQLRLPLRGDVWEGVKDTDFEVKVSSTEISVRCGRRQSQDLDDLNGRFRRGVDPKACWYAVERDVQDPGGQNRVLLIELGKKEPGKAWPQESIFVEQMFNRKFFGWNKEMKDEEVDGGMRTLKAGRPADLDDPFVSSRGWLCNDLTQGQTPEILQFRILLDQKKLNECMEKVPYYKMWGVDISEKYLKFFIRGDESSPVLLGELGGKVVPHATTILLCETTRPIKGHRIEGTMETLPCLEITMLKAEGSMTEWEELLLEQDVNGPQGSLEEFEEKQLRAGRDQSPDREDWTPDDWADEQKAKADAAFKDGSFRDAIVYYTRALRFTPLSEKLLCNRSAGYLKINKFQLALDDAAKAEELEPQWAKVFFRKGQALRGLRRFPDALAAFGEGLALDPGSPEWEKEIKRTQEAQSTHAQKRVGARARD